MSQAGHRGSKSSNVSTKFDEKFALKMNPVCYPIFCALL